MYLSRWRALPDAGAWKVAAEGGHLAPEPHHYPEHRDAQRRADELNRAEQQRNIEAMQR